MVRVPRLELGTFRLGGGCSIHLSYTRTCRLIISQKRRCHACGRVRRRLPATALAGQTGVAIVSELVKLDCSRIEPPCRNVAATASPASRQHERFFQSHGWSAN